MRTPAKLLAIAAAGGALAIGVPAALAATDAPSTTPVQNATPAPDHPRGDDCPEKGGRGAGSSDNSQGSAPDAPTATPDV